MLFLSDACDLDPESTETKVNQGKSIQLCKPGKAFESPRPETGVVV